jgi:hypothetical protein
MRFATKLAKMSPKFPVGTENDRGSSVPSREAAQKYYVTCA